jgi:hypothetical protein
VHNKGTIQCIGHEAADIEPGRVQNHTSVKRNAEDKRRSLTTQLNRDTNPPRAESNIPELDQEDADFQNKATTRQSKGEARVPNKNLTMNNYDSDSDEEAKGPSPEESPYDPERNERIRQMMAASNAHNVLADDQVTDFVLRMAEKNQNQTTTMEQAQPQQQPRYTISDSDEEENADELDVSYGDNTQTRRSTGKRSSRRSTPDDFPPGEAYAGDEEGAGPDEIPSYDPKDDDFMNYGRLCCVASALVLGMIVTSILILVLVVYADGGAATTFHHNSGGLDGIVLPSAPSNLSDMCDLENLKTIEGVLDCKEACMRAACCWEKGYGGEQPVCWESHPLECAPYESCVNLRAAGSDNPSSSQQDRPTSTVPHAPVGIDSCKADTIDSVDQVLMCENACRLGECCWKTGASNCNTDPNCADYQVCDILNEGAGSSTAGIWDAASLVAAPTNLEEICSQQSVESCQEECNKATCCWNVATHAYLGSFGETITESVFGSCAKENLDICKGYEPCRYLPFQDANKQGANFQTVVIPPAPTGLNATCAVSLEGDCKNSCDKATCCWQLQTHSYTGAFGEVVAETVVGACTHRDECVGYEPCRALPVDDADEAGTTMPPTSSPASVPATEQTNLEAVCAQSLDGACRDICNQAECCWKLATSTYAGPTGEMVTESISGVCSHLLECDAYAACKKLPEATASHLHDNMTAAPNHLNETCAASFDGTCRDACNQATCCWKLATTTMTGPHGAFMTESVMGSCSREQPTFCAEYAICKKLPEAIEEPPVTTPTAHLTVPEPDADLAEICKAFGGSLDELALCEQYCSDAFCCWKSSTHAYTDAGGEVITESKQGACSQQPGCDAYKPCSILDPDAIDPTPSPVPLAASPSISPPPFSSTTEYTEDLIFDVCFNHEGKTLCEKVCEPGVCCFKAGETCPTDGTIDCSKYEPCQVLLQGDGNGVPSAVETACSDRTDLAPCVEQCAKGTCCFTTDLGKTCDIAAPETICSEFTACEVLYNGVSNP